MRGGVSRSASPTARLALAVVIGLLIYASLFPNSGWSDTGVPFYAWAFAPLPRYWTHSEIAFNVVLYMPVGALLVWSLMPRVRGLPGVIVGTLLAAAISAAMESLQTFLPDRYASNLDFAVNSAGALAGALLGWASAGVLARLSRRMRWPESPLLPRTHPALILAALWLLVQIPSHAMLFGTGDVIGLLPQITLRLETWLPSLMNPAPVWRMRAEALCTASAIVGVTMLLMHCLQPGRWRLWLAPVLILLALSLKVAAQPITVTATWGNYAWLTPGAVRGLWLGAMAALALTLAPARWQRRVGLLAILVQVLVVNGFPADRYFLASMATGYTGLLHLEELTRELAVVWPFIAWGWMVLSSGSRAAAAPPPAQPAEA